MMQVELLQPWSTFVMKTQLPPPVLEKMLKITDEIIVNVESRLTAHRNIEDEFNIEHESLEREDLMTFFLDVVRQFVIQQTLQVTPHEEERKKILNDEWYTKMASIWVVSQKDNEYQPVHMHSECDVSTVMYLKIPEYLPSKNTAHWNDDGAICFFNNSSADKIWGKPSMTLQPRVGEFYIFPASQTHLVYPFRTADGKGERRSVSFNAVFSNKTEQERLKIQ